VIAAEVRSDRNPSTAGFRLLTTDCELAAQPPPPIFDLQY
jgi:hypothetical protein